ncbi:MAG: hypothetical protein R3C45_04025 [Phycisphaerales bacterium]
MVNKAELLHLLLVEDDEDHAFWFPGISRSAVSQIRSTTWWTASRRLDYLFSAKAYGQPRPDVILLDLKLPKIDGHEVLETIKNGSAFAQGDPCRDPDDLGIESDRTSSVCPPRQQLYRQAAGRQRVPEMVEQLSLYWGMLNMGPPPTQLVESA